MSGEFGRMSLEAPAEVPSGTQSVPRPYANWAGPGFTVLNDESAPLCATCGLPIRRDPRSPTGWTHGRTRRHHHHWQGKRCPGRITGATPLDWE